MFIITNFMIYSHGIRAPIPQTQGVLIEQELQTSKSLFSIIYCYTICLTALYPIGPTFHRRQHPRSVFDPFQDFSAGQLNCF